MESDHSLLPAHRDHARSWEDFLYVYAVVSRRSGGVSIGVNLNPDKQCNFNCAYCEVDRIQKPRIREVKLDILQDELRRMIGVWETGELFSKEPFFSTPPEWRNLKDIAFSGDGEPTTCPVFNEAVGVVAKIREELAPPETKLVLITDAACLDDSQVRQGLKFFKEPNEIWAKLDAGTSEYFKKINRTVISFEHILKNITETAREIPLTIQSLFVRLREELPPDSEIEAYCQRLQEIMGQGGKIEKLQLYTMARPAPVPWVKPLTKEELDCIALKVRERVDLPQQLAYGPAETMAFRSDAVPKNPSSAEKTKIKE